MRAYYRNGTTVRPLADGDTRTVTALFERLGERSRRHRFAGPKPRLSQRELEALARADGDHHALVAYVEDDPEPAGMAWLVRDRRTADVVVRVVMPAARASAASISVRSDPIPRP